MVSIMIGLGIGTSPKAGPPPSPAAPVNVSAPAISGTVQQGQTLTTSNGSWTGYPSPSFAYQWKRGGVDISGATSQTYTLVSGDVAENITVTVTATNGSGSASATSVAVGPVIIAAPVNTVAPVVSGTTTEGQTLSVTNGTWNNTPSSYAYQWKRGGVAISGATSSTYVLVTADVGATISCDVTAANAGGSTPQGSNSVGPISAASVPVPVNTAAPVISGTPTVGQTLSTTNGTWTNSPTGYAYQWKRGGVSISGATDSTYALVSRDIGANITCVITASNAGGAGTPATSNSIGPVVAGGGGYDTDADAYITGYTPSATTTFKDALNAMVVDLKAQGFWAKLDGLIVPADTGTGTQRNVRNLSKSVAIYNSPTFTAYRGYQGDGVSAYIGIGEAWAAVGNQFSRNSATMGVWCNLATGSTTAAYHLGDAGGTTKRIQAGTSTTAGSSRLNGTASNTHSGEGASRAGHRTITRLSSSDQRFYFNGANEVARSDATSAAPSTTDEGFFLRNSSTYGPDRVALVYWGSGLTATEVTAIHTILNTFLTAIGAN